eukprot:Em0001g1394a
MSFENRTCLNFSSTEFKIIAGVKATVGFTTVLLGTITIIVNVTSRKYLFSFHRKVLYAGLAVVIEGLSSMFNRVDYFFESEATRTYCVFAGLLNRYSNLALAFSSLAITSSLFLDGLYADRARSYQGVGRRPNSCRLSDWLWPVLIFVAPLLLVWTPFLRSAYGQSPGWPWCTVRTLNDDCSAYVFGLGVNLTLFTVNLLVMAAVVSSYIAVVVILAIRRKGRREINYDDVIVTQKKLMNRELQVLVLPVLYMAVKFVVTLVNLIVNRPGQFVFAVWIVYAAIASASGITALTMTLSGSKCDRRCCRSVLLCENSKNYISEYITESPKSMLVENDEQDMAIAYHRAI